MSVVAKELQKENEARILKELEQVETQLGLAKGKYNEKGTKANAAAVKYYEEKRDNILRRLQGGGRRQSRRRRVINIDRKTMKDKEANLPTISAKERQRRSGNDNDVTVKSEVELDNATSKALNRLYNIDNLTWLKQELEDEVEELEQEMQLLRIKKDNAKGRLKKVTESLKKNIAKKNSMMF